ncbi:MAG TPA: hypothetical protein VKV25_04220 [Acidimicrobiales bacterium]|nr:hypothetical protein [Acidimicrobiales bacterium]
MVLDVELLYRQHLTDTDRRVLASFGSGAPLASLLSRPDVEAAVFGSDGEPGRTDGLAMVSPFLLFAVAIHRTVQRLETTTFVEERWAPRQRVPLFDVASLRRLVADPLRRYFLVELLASYTRVASGATWTRTGRGWRRRRYSELDPARMAELLEVVPEEQRPGVYRRLGDLALFLTGVFPDRAALPPGAGGERLLRLSGVPADAEVRDTALFELLGARWYGKAVAMASAAGVPATGTLAVTAEIGRHFGDARRVLNAVTDRYLFPFRERWFGPS